MQNFDLRVYGLLINDKQQILLSDECENGRFFTKFPGGGVEYGEGILSALHREFLEELNLEISEAKPLSFTDFYTESPFEENSQLVCFYYLVKCDFSKIKTFDYQIPFSVEGEKQRWVSIQDLNENEITFKHDKVASEKLKNWAQKKRGSSLNLF